MFICFLFFLFSLLLIDYIFVEGLGVWICCIWQIDIIFASKYCGEMREAAKVLTKRLAQTAQETFGDFEEAVEKDATKTAVLDGTVHPLTSYVINYVKFVFE